MTHIITHEQETRELHDLHSLDQYISDSGLMVFFRPNDTFPKRVAEKAAELKDDPNNILDGPEQIQDLSRLALYQLVFYCGKRHRSIALKCVG
jgi:hypothetical protein